MVNEFKKVLVDGKMELKKVRELDASKYGNLKYYEDIVEFFNDYYDLNLCLDEYCYIIGYDRSLNPLGVAQVAHGINGEVEIGHRELFELLFGMYAEQFVMVHNHPHNNMEIPDEDVNLTETISDICEYFDIDLMEHIIIGRNSHALIKEYIKETESINKCFYIKK